MPHYSSPEHTRGDNDSVCVFTANDRVLFLWILTTLTAVFLGCVGIALAGIFTQSVVLFFIVVAIASIFAVFRRTLARPSAFAIIVLSVSITIGALVAWFLVVPTVFTGRDQGSYATAGLILAQTGSRTLVTPETQLFYDITGRAAHEQYGAAEAKNFPGYFYTQNGGITLQFLPGYSSFLAVFALFLGIKGIIIAQGVALAWFLFAFAFVVGSFVARRSVALLVLLFAGLSVPLLFTASLPLSETFAMALWWTSIAMIVHAVARPTITHFLLAFLPITLLAATRIEGLALIVTAALVLFPSWWSLRPTERRTVAALGAVFILVIGGVFAASLPFVRTLISALRDTGMRALEEGAVHAGYFSGVRILMLYGCGGILGAGLIGIVWTSTKRHWQALIPIVLTAPLFIYLVAPTVTPDHPWMLRRFTIGVVPLALYGTALTMTFLLTEAQRARAVRRSVFLLFFGLIVGGVVLPLQQPLAVLLSVRDHDDLLDQAQRIADRFSEHDLLLIDRGVTGDPYAMLPGALTHLHNRHAVYLFDPRDVREILASPYRTQFDRIFLIAPWDQKEFWKDIAGEKTKHMGILVPTITLPQAHPTEPLPIPKAIHTLNSVTEIQ